MRKLRACAIIVLLIAGCGMELKPTPEKTYRDEIAKMKIVKEHQILQFEIMKINQAIEQMKALADAKMPTYQLAPVEPTDKTERLSSMNPDHRVPGPNVPDPNE